MPIYEYECTRCGHQTEVWQNFSDPPIAKCQLCRGKMKKLISQSTFHLKGTGWYVTDYATDRRGSVERMDKSEKDAASKEGKASTESKKDVSSTSGKKAKD